MKDQLRFTGEWPGPDVLVRYPNWEYAVDEEDIDGQDETTIRPSDIQTEIDESVVFTTADVSFSDNRQWIGLIETDTDGVVGMNILADNEWFRLIRSLDQIGQFVEWKPFAEDWLPEDEQSVSLDMTDTTVFPLQITSRLPYYATSEQLRIMIDSNGGETIL